MKNKGRRQQDTSPFLRAEASHSENEKKIRKGEKLSRRKYSLTKLCR